MTSRAASAMPRLADVPLREGQRVMVRVDMNAPCENGEVVDDSRLRAHLPTIRFILRSGARVILVSHLGRPEAGRFDAKFSLAPVATRLGELLEQPVALRDCLADDSGDGSNNGSNDGDAPAAPVTLCENIRFYAGEKTNDVELAKRLAALCDVFVMDAFGCAHRAHASVCGVAEFARVACAGPLLLAETGALSRVMDNPARPLLVIVGGAKTETKLGVLDALGRVADELIAGGAIANTLLVAAGKSVGRSLYDSDYVEAARALPQTARAFCLDDVVCAATLSDDAPTRERSVDEVGADDMILDFGSRSLRRVEEAVARAATILWNGPLGAFEFTPFARGTETLARAVARSSAYSVAGGGDTLAAINRFGIADDISHISTGGGAFLEWIQQSVSPTGDLPAVAALRKRKAA